MSVDKSSPWFQNDVVSVERHFAKCGFYVTYSDGSSKFMSDLEIWQRKKEIDNDVRRQDS